MSTHNPQPEYDGECAFAVSTGKRHVTGSANRSLSDGDRIYYFKNSAARLLWKVLPGRAAKADAIWAAA